MPKTKVIYSAVHKTLKKLHIMIDKKPNKGRLCVLNVRKKSLAKFLEEQTQLTSRCTQLEAIHSSAARM